MKWRHNRGTILILFSAMNKVRQKRRVFVLFIVAILLYLFTITKQNMRPKRDLVDESLKQPARSALKHLESEHSNHNTNHSKSSLKRPVTTEEKVRRHESKNYLHLLETKGQVNEEESNLLAKYGNEAYNLLNDLFVNKEDETDNRTVQTLSDPNIVLANNDTNLLKCTLEIKQAHILLVDYEAEDIEHALFQLFCAFVFASRSCYTVAIYSDTIWFQRLINPYFDLHGVDFVQTPILSFSHLTIDNGKIKGAIFGHNVSMSDRCEDYDELKGQEHIIRSSISIQSKYVKKAREYLSKNVENGTVASVYIENIFSEPNENGSRHLSVYKPYIRKAISHLQINHPNLTTVLICSDRLGISDCREQFNGEDWLIFPLKAIAEGLALLSISEHVILTTGVVGWQVTLLSDHKTVVFNSKFTKQSLTALGSVNSIEIH